MNLKLFVNGTTDSRTFTTYAAIAKAIIAARKRGDAWDVRHDEGSAPLTPIEQDRLIAALLVFGASR
jgi:hypothetical protein